MLTCNRRERKSKPDSPPKMSPWGAVQAWKKLAEGVYQVHTAGHGGIRVRRDLNITIPEYMRDPSGWYEEDCAAAIPLIALGINSSAVIEKTLMNWYPDEWERLRGRKLQPGESFIRDKNDWELANRERWSAASAESRGDGMVLVTARRICDGPDGPRKMFIVPKTEYTFPFACDEGQYPQV